MGYSAEDNTVLSGLEAVRRRPEMYIGPVDSDDAMSRLVEQVLCGSLDEAVSGRCSHIAVLLHADGTVTVEDDGAGMPMDRDKEGVPVAERLMTRCARRSEPPARGRSCRRCRTSRATRPCSISSSSLLTVPAARARAVARALAIETVGRRSLLAAATPPTAPKRTIPSSMFRIGRW